MKNPLYYLRFTLLLLVLLLPATTVGNPISREQAQQNAVSFLKSKGKFASSASLRLAPSMMTTAVENYYVFNIGNKEGYVIAAGDDCAPAILGYSESGYINVDSMPCNMKAWLREYANQIRYMQERGDASNISSKSLPTHPIIPPMLTTSWGQGYPYNINCPSFFGQGQCVTGCIATAMAQVMYYHRANTVTCTTAEIPAYVCDRYWTIESETLQLSVDAIPAGSVIDWDNMFDSYSSSITDVQKQAVANLMKYCGAAVRMDYGMDVSGAAFRNIPIALNNYFGYSNETVLKNRNVYNDVDWDNLIYNELSNNHPVLYGGANSNGGHEFVCDGYDDGGYYHINWGWNGSCDGYFLLSALNPGSSSNGYNMSQNAVLHAVPKSAHFISFTDKQVRDLCLQNWDTNSDGELSEKEASEVTNLGDVFKRSSITSFNELMFFTGLSSINEYAFEGCDLLASIQIPSNVITIDDYSFSNCYSLQSITIPNAVTAIGDHAFSNTGLTSVTLSSNLASLGNSAFESCEFLESITIPNSVTAIGDHAFSNTGLSSIILSSSLSFIENSVFEGCESLESVIIPNTITAIGSRAFANTGLTSITLPSSVATIGSGAFALCDALMTVTCFGNEPPVLENSGCFSNSCYTRATLRVPPEAYDIYRNTNYWKLFRNTIQIPNIIFDDNNVKAICVQNWDTNGDGELSEREAVEVTSLGEIFKGCSIHSFDELRYFIGLVCIDNNSFNGCRNLTSVTIPSSVISIGDNAFERCSSLTSIIIPPSVKTISRCAFTRCSNLTFITLNSGLTSIGDNVFEYCKSLQAIKIPSSVISIGGEALKGCSGLSTILVNSGNLSYDSRNNCNAIIETASNTLIVGCKTTVIPSDVTAIGENAFRDCSSLTNLNIPSSILSIGRNAFLRCSGLCSITVDLNNPVYDSRNNCNAIIEKSTNVLILGCKNTIIPTTANKIGDNAFEGCVELESISIPSSINSIGGSAFSECTSLSSVSIPSSVTTIGDHAFYGCVCLKNLDIPIGVTTIGNWTFSNCQSIISITIPSSVITMGNEAFRECSALTNVTIGRNVSSIGNWAFDECDSLMTVTCLGRVPLVKDFWGGETHDCFSDHCFTQATLRVPNDYISDYLADEHWNKFAHFEGFEYNSRGDSDGDGKVTIADVTTLIDYLLSGNAGSVDMMSADPDNDGKVTIADVTTLIDYLLSGVWSYTPDIPDEPEIETFTVNGISFSMVAVEGGTFTMGATPEQNDAYENETPTHQVTLTDYSIGETEVTQELWQAVMGDNPSSHTGNLKYPVDCVNWDMAQEFITRLNSLTGLTFRLPTEAEWEFAARGGRNSKGYKHAGSNTLDAVAWYCENSGDSTHLVGLKKANELGIYDMNGNIWEWTLDWYGTYSSEAQTNPIGPASGDRKVHRGGCFNNSERQSRVSGERGSYWPDFGSTGEGFRLAMSPRLILEKDYATVVIGDQIRIGIENGHGHTFNVSYASEYVTCRVDGGSVVITGFKEGTTKVTIIDCNNNAKATLTVVIVKGQTFTVNGVSFTMVNIDGGSFIMGATNEQEGDARDNEKPTHEVTLSGFSIGQTEVTQELWKAVMGNNNSSFTGDMHRPEEQVSWNGAQEFISKLNELTGKTFRLPTEAEWEYAARGGNKSLGFKYAGSDNIEEVAWYSPDGPEDWYAIGDWDLGTHAVAKKKPNELGLYDMSGNVAEWCYDWRGNYTSESQINPTGPATGTSRMLRGGSWSNCAKGCRVSFRESDGTEPDRISFNFGLRLVLDETEEITVNGVSFKMIKVKGGTFTMGATDEQGNDAGSNESPTHQVTLSDYFMGQTEVTQELWQAVMGDNPSSDNSDGKYPVNRVSWNKVQDFITQLNNLTGMSFRLPTEAEWEFAARGGNLSKGFKHAGSNDIDEVAWYGNNSSGKLHVVGLKMPNELGMYDMNGNVWEWTQDWYGTYSSESQTNPTGPSSGSSKVHRGGCWNNNSQYSRVSGVRHTYPPTVGGTGEGFRLAL